jgi:hypothetical protein
VLTCDWNVLVVQKELNSDDRRKLWGSPVRVYAAPPGTPARIRPGRLRSRLAGADQGRPAAPTRAPGTGALF